MIRDVGRASELVRLDVEELAVDGDHGVVDPDVDRSEFGLRGGRSGLDLVGVGDVGREGECAAAELLHLPRRSLKAGLAAREQRDARAVSREAPRRRAADPCQTRR